MAIPPAPIQNKQFNSAVWNEWFRQIRDQVIATATSVPWSTINFTGSNITSIVTRNHNDLTTKQGGTTGEYYHLTSAEYTGTGTGVFARQDSPSFLTQITLPKTSGAGIKVDTTSPTYGWHDLLGDMKVRGIGATDPSWNTYRNGIKQYQFTINDELWVEFHIPHDYVPGTDIFIHVHWSHIATTVTSGSATWGIEHTYAKGHNQAAFPATKTLTIIQAASTTQYQHMIAEGQLSAASPAASQMSSSILEPDGVILVRCYLSASTINGSPEPFVHYVDIHYQSTGIPTKQKAPNFYT